MEQVREVIHYHQQVTVDEVAYYLCITHGCHFPVSRETEVMQPVSKHQPVNKISAQTR
jgi:hypothetical protein